MKKLLLMILTLTFIVKAQTLSEKIEFQYHKPLFTVFAWLNAAKFSEVDSARMNKTSEFVWKRVHSTLKTPELDSLINRYKIYSEKYGFMLDYILTVFALNCKDSPDFRTRINELKLFDEINQTNNKWTINRLTELQEFSQILRDFYIAADIKSLYKECGDSYNQVCSEYSGQVYQQLTDSFDYLRLKETSINKITKVVIIPNLLGSEGEMGPEYLGIKYDVKGPSKIISYHPHEFIHSLVRDLTFSKKYEKKIYEIVENIKGNIAGTPAAKSYPDEIIYFDECLVRVISTKVYYMKSSGRKDKISASLKNDNLKGFVLVNKMGDALKDFEKSGSSFADYFPTFLDKMKQE